MLGSGATVVFRADANSTVGFGHVSRCLALAEALMARGARILFLGWGLHPGAAHMISARGAEVHELGAEEDAWSLQADAEACKAMLAGLPSVSWLVVDHYGLGVDWAEQLRNSVERLAVIDDYAEQPRQVDLLINHNHLPGLRQAYRSLLPKQTLCLTGPRFALIGPQFSALRTETAVSSRPVRDVMVSFGGSDPKGLTLKTMQAIAQLQDLNWHWRVVTGAGNPQFDEIKVLAEGLACVSLERHIDDMARALVESDLVLGSMGTSTWERMCLSVPSVVIATADNQAKPIRALSDDGLVIYLGEAEEVDVAGLVKTLRGLSGLGLFIQGMADRGAKLVDGRGASRVAAVMLPDRVDILLRPTGDADVKQIQRWLLDDPVCLQGFTEDPSYRHVPVGSTDRILLIADKDQRSIGVLRYDLAPTEAAVSIFLDPQYRGQGIALAVLSAGERLLKEQYPQVSRLVSEISPEDFASMRLFENAGYENGKYTFFKTLSDQ